MEKPCRKVRDLISWLNQGNWIELCTQPGCCFGNINCSSEPPQSNPEPSLNTLIRWGLVDVTEQFYAGIRWSRFVLNDYGLEYIARCEAQL